MKTNKITNNYINSISDKKNNDNTINNNDKIIKKLYKIKMPLFNISIEFYTISTDKTHIYYDNVAYSLKEFETTIYLLVNDMFNKIINEKIIENT